jgi:hypothetical protein
MDKGPIPYYNETKNGGVIMNKILAAIIFSVLIAGCVAHVTPEGTYLEPLPMSVVVGPPVIVEPPRPVAVQPLPPVVLMPERRVYYQNNLYYYYWDNSWYYGERERGPWHRLPREYYPKKYRERGRDQDRDYRPRDRY